MFFSTAQKLTVLQFTALCGLTTVSPVIAAPPAAKAEAHEHAEVGPHKGPLVELGEEEYHAEFVLDEKMHTVSVYLLDGEVKNYVAIPAKEIAITLKHDGKVETFKLKAVPQKTDPKGMSSLFSLKDEELVDDIHHKEHDPRLLVKIDGKPFNAKIDLGHDDDHKHDEKKKK